MVAIIGADTTAGSIRIFLSTSGRTEDTSADHNTMAATVRVTVSVICGPTPRLQARIVAATAIATAISVPVDISLATTAGRSRNLTWPVPIARTSVVVIWVP